VIIEASFFEIVFEGNSRARISGSRRALFHLNGLASGFFAFRARTLAMFQVLQICIAWIYGQT
jgi:hypothetical protein